MKVLERGTIERTAENKRWFGNDMTGETLTIGDENGSTTYVVKRGRTTLYGTVRDCGDHYIKAGYSGYDRIDKATLEITENVEDR